MKRYPSWLALTALTLLSACKRDRSQAVAASYSSVTKPASVAAPLSAVGIAAIAVEEEYEERSASAITQASLAAQVVEIEKELR